MDDQLDVRFWRKPRWIYKENDTASANTNNEITMITLATKRNNTDINLRLNQAGAIFSDLDYRAQYVNGSTTTSLIHQDIKSDKRTSTSNASAVIIIIIRRNKNVIQIQLSRTALTCNERE